MNTAQDKNGFPVWAGKHVFRGDPIWVRFTHTESGVTVIGSVDEVSEDGLLDVFLRDEDWTSIPGASQFVQVGAAQVERLFCSCEVEDDGDVESGPHISIVDPSRTCDLHGENGPEGFEWDLHGCPCGGNCGCACSENVA